MVTCLPLLFSLFLVSTSWAIPVQKHSPNSLQFPPISVQGLLCGLPIPIVQKLLCPRKGSSSPTIDTPLGEARGLVDVSGAVRFSVKYGSASRWQPSEVVSTWELPNNSTDVSALPLACPQDGLDNSAMSEDCLSMVLYVPQSVMSGTKVPALMWIHGGSFIMGAASGPGLDGSTLATATNSIVAVIQYRLGALGFMAPSGGMNLAVKDVMTALQFLQNVLPSIGGDSSKITLAGQSSGASMIRTLLAVPSASSLFQSAIIQSDPMDYGFLSTGTQQTLQNFFNQQLSCSPSDTSCLNSISLNAILTAQDYLLSNATSLDPSTGAFSPIRPVHDGSLVTTTLDSTSPFPHVNKPLLISTVVNEAGFTIYGGFPSAMDTSLYQLVVAGTFGQPRTNNILANSNYAPPPASDGNVDVRPTLESLGTDQIWRCPTWTFARNWVTNGGNAFVGEYIVGASYPGNSAVPFCTQPGVVCHQDDIEIVFGTVPSPSSAQTALTTEMQARYGAFMRTGNPNTGSLRTWTAATNDDVHALQLGGSGEVAAGACIPTFWGSAVQYDYQVFGI